MPLSKLTPKARAFLKHKKPAVYKKFATHGGGGNLSSDTITKAAKKAAKNSMRKH